ncbi:hypothetical protein N7497_001559 [Penicillium chrysogenum]|nr:hypothetical protein N7497_001559 [Penicillium chrysogenum]
MVLYFAGTGICNVVRVDSVQDAGKRAAKLSLINLFPMFLGGGYEFSARLLGVSLHSYGFLHRLFALVTLVEALAHVIIVARSRLISWANEMQFYGLLLIRIIYRNVVMGRSYVRMNLQPYMGDVARMTLSLPRPWVVRAGQRINLGVPSVGIFYIFQSHPFAISWWESDVNGRAVSISILLRPRSGFTKRLFDRIEPNRDYGAWIDGPFGPSSVSWRLSCNVGDYGHTFMIATGIGIAAQLPYIKELLDGHEKAQVRTQRISLVWQLDRIGDYESARDLLQVLVRQDNGYVSTNLCC